MTAFLNQHSTFVLDSFTVPITSNNMTSLLEQETIPSTTTCFPQTLSQLDLQEISLYAQVHETSPLDKSMSVKVPSTCTNNTDSSVNVKEDTMVVDQVIPVVPMQRKIKSIDMKVEGESNATKQRKHSGSKKEEKRGLKPDAKKQKKVPEEAPTGYVHVRARRGQATDSHSLAERVRREKISVRMKMLQSLVPGCDKIVGKAHILDEIINYVQSLHNQVEVLRAKLASIDSMFRNFEVDFNTNTFESEKLCSLELPLPSVLESNSTQLTPFSETTPTLTSILLHQEQIFNVNSQDNGNVLWGTDDQRENLVKQYAFDDFCIF